MTIHGVTGVCECPGGQGVLITPAKAVSVGSHVTGPVPQATVVATALTAPIGIIEGAKKSIAPGLRAARAGLRLRGAPPVAYGYPPPVAALCGRAAAAGPYWRGYAPRYAYAYGHWGHGYRRW